MPVPWKLKGVWGACCDLVLNRPIFNFTTWKYPSDHDPCRFLKEWLTSSSLMVIGITFIFHSLDYFPRDFCILLPEYVDHPGLEAQTIERTLRAMGFHNIKKIKPWTPFIEAYPLQLFQLKPVLTTGRNSGFVLEPELSLINMNDNILDSELAAQIHKRFDAFDIGFIQSVGSACTQAV